MVFLLIEVPPQFHLAGPRHIEHEPTEDLFLRPTNLQTAEYIEGRYA